MAAKTQHELARKILALIGRAYPEQLLTYGRAAEALGRKYSDARAVAQACDLLDAAAAVQRVPLLALVAVRDVHGKVNPKAWRREVNSDVRKKIIECSTAHKFSASDLAAIREGLRTLSEFGNRRAWQRVFDILPRERVLLHIAGGRPGHGDDALDDLDQNFGTNHPALQHYAGARYSRDSKVRDAVERLSHGCCEYCGALGFQRTNGTPYVETHHIIALAADGADRVSNVIALCPWHHREAHFGLEREALEQEFLTIVSGRLARRSVQGSPAPIAC